MYYTMSLCRGSALGAEAVSLFSPLERVFDELLVVQKEEGGVPPRHFSWQGLEEAVASAESFSLLHDDTIEGPQLHMDVVDVTNLKMVIFLAKNVVVQAATMADEVDPRGEGEDEHPVVLELRQLVVDLEGVQARHVATAGSFMEVVREGSSETEDSHALHELVEKIMETTAVTERVLEGDDMIGEGGKVLNDLGRVKDEIGQALNSWVGANLMSLDTRDIWSLVSPQSQEGMGKSVGQVTPCTARARGLRKRLVDAVELQPLLEATKESEKKLAQVRRSKGSSSSSFCSMSIGG